MPEFRRLEDETFVMDRERAIDQIIATYGIAATEPGADPGVDYFRHALSALRAMGATQEDINAWSLRPNYTTLAEVWQ